MPRPRPNQQSLTYKTMYLSLSPCFVRARSTRISPQRKSILLHSHGCRVDILMSRARDLVKICARARNSLISSSGSPCKWLQLIHSRFKPLTAPVGRHWKARLRCRLHTAHGVKRVETLLCNSCFPPSLRIPFKNPTVKLISSCTQCMKQAEKAMSERSLLTVLQELGICRGKLARRTLR